MSSSLPAANPGPAPANLNPLVLFNQEVIRCQRCSRLRKYCEEIATSKRRSYRDWNYWAKPVPSFGDEKAHMLILGLAPGAHGSNRTGRPFTGDGSGDFLYPVLYDAGLASQPNSVSRGDGMQLRDCWISSVVRCAPPDNTPKRSELQNCSSYLDQEISLLTNLKVVVCLGRIAFDGYLEHLTRTGQSERKPRFKFAHGAEYALPGGRYMIASSTLRYRTPTPASSRATCFLTSSSAPASSPGRRDEPFAADGTKAGCPIQAVFWLEWDATALHPSVPVVWVRL